MVKVVDYGGSWQDIIDDTDEDLGTVPFDSLQGPPEGGLLEDDFHRTIGDLNRAAVIPGVGQVDDLVREHRYQEGKRAEEDHLSRFVQINPRSAFGSSANMGAIQEITSGAVSRPCVFWSGENDAEARNLTVMISRATQLTGGSFPTATNGAGTAFSYRPFAIIRYGSRGSSSEITVDVGRGVQVSVAGASCYVSVGMDAAPSGRVAGTMQLSASLSFGSRQQAAPVQRTAYIDSLAAASTQNVVIPTFATRLLPICRADLTGTVQVNILDTNSTVLYSFSLAGASVQQNQPIPLSNDAYSIDVTNNGSISSTFRLVFELSL